MGYGINVEIGRHWHLRVPLTLGVSIYDFTDILLLSSGASFRTRLVLRLRKGRPHCTCIEDNENDGIISGHAAMYPIDKLCDYFARFKAFRLPAFLLNSNLTR